MAIPISARACYMKRVRCKCTSAQLEQKVIRQLPPSRQPHQSLQDWVLISVSYLPGGQVVGLVHEQLEQLPAKAGHQGHAFLIVCHWR